MVAPSGSFALDFTTLAVVATSVTALLGLMLLFAWLQDRVKALAWWGAAYLIGGLSVVIWSLESALPIPPGIGNTLLFLACGMIWSAARLFHGRPVQWIAQSSGAALWLLLTLIPAFAEWGRGRVILTACIVATYTMLAAAELWRERRKSLIRRWPALFVPALHGAIFLFPIPLANLMPEDGGMLSFASGWVAVIAIEMMLYAVGTAFLVLILSKDRVLRIHKDAASTDLLTGIFNRRGFEEAVAALIVRAVHAKAQVTILLFDLDHFKAINDRLGHHAGDDVLRAFASTVSTQMRAGDVVGRVGGEEFAAVIVGSADDGYVAAERVRRAFAAAGQSVQNQDVGATVSIGVASMPASQASLETLLIRGDRALYRAKEKGRNRVEIDPALMPATGSAATQLAFAS